MYIGMSIEEVRRFEVTLQEETNKKVLEGMEGSAESDSG